MKKLVLGINAGLTLLVLLLLIDIVDVWYSDRRDDFVQNDSGIGVCREKIDDPSDGRMREHVKRIIQADIFQTISEKRVISQVESDDLPPTHLSLMLKGTAIHSQRGCMAMVLDKTKNHEGVYREGEDVGGARITKVYRDRIVLDVCGKSEVLKMGGDAGRIVDGPVNRNIVSPKPGPPVLRKKKASGRRSIPETQS